LLWKQPARGELTCYHGSEQMVVHKSG
jgi:hypothetical protein